MLNHGLSHAGAALVTTLTADLIGSEILTAWPELRGVLIEHLSPRLMDIGYGADANTAAGLTVVVVLGFIWGVFFKLTKRGE